MRCVLALCTPATRARAAHAFLRDELSNRERHQLQSISRRSGALRAEVNGESSANALAVGLRTQRRPFAQTSLVPGEWHGRGEQERLSKRYRYKLVVNGTIYHFSHPMSAGPVSYPSNTPSIAQPQRCSTTCFSIDDRLACSTLVGYTTGEDLAQRGMGHLRTSVDLEIDTQKRAAASYLSHRCKPIRSWRARFQGRVCCGICW